MNVREYLQSLPQNASVTFIKQIAVKDEGAPGYRDEYRTTPIWSAWEWLRSEKWCEEHLVVNADHPPIDATGAWGNWYKHGRLSCAMITSEAELIKHYGESQGRSMVEFYRRKVR